MRVVGVDPGVHGLGVGVLEQTRHGLIAVATYLPNRGPRSGPAMWAGQAAALAGLLPADLLVIESMQVDGRSRRAQVHALLELQGLVGRLSSLVPVERVECPTPSTWAGSVPKGVRNNRLRERYGDSFVVRPGRYASGGGRSDDSVDGLGLAEWGLRRLQNLD